MEEETKIYLQGVVIGISIGLALSVIIRHIVG